MRLAAQDHVEVPVSRGGTAAVLDLEVRSGIQSATHAQERRPTTSAPHDVTDYFTECRAMISKERQGQFGVLQVVV